MEGVEYIFYSIGSLFGEGRLLNMLSVTKPCVAGKKTRATPERQSQNRGNRLDCSARSFCGARCHRRKGCGGAESLCPNPAISANLKDKRKPTFLLVCASALSQ